MYHCKKFDGLHTAVPSADPRCKVKPPESVLQDLQTCSITRSLGGHDAGAAWFGKGPLPRL